MAPPRQVKTVFRSVRARFAPLARCAWFFAGVFFPDPGKWFAPSVHLPASSNGWHSRQVKVAAVFDQAG